MKSEKYLQLQKYSLLTFNFSLNLDTAQVVAEEREREILQIHFYTLYNMLLYDVEFVKKYPLSIKPEFLIDIKKRESTANASHS